MESKLRLVVYYLLLLAIPVGVSAYGMVLNLKYVSNADVLKIKIILHVIYAKMLSKQSISVYTLYFHSTRDKDHPMYGEKSCFAPAWPVTDYLIFGTESLTFLIILLSISHIFSRLSASTDVDDAPRYIKTKLMKLIRLLSSKYIL